MPRNVLDYRRPDTPAAAGHDPGRVSLAMAVVTTVAVVGTDAMGRLGWLGPRDEFRETLFAGVVFLVFPTVWVLGLVVGLVAAVEGGRSRLVPLAAVAIDVAVAAYVAAAH